MTNRVYRNKHTYPLTREKGRQKPRIPIRIRNFSTGEFLIANALVDTGSDSCVFPNYITKALGYELNEGDKKHIGIKGISEIELDCYVHGFKIDILDSHKLRTLVSIDTVAYTVESDNITPLLGTYRLLDFFKIEIDYNNDTITLNW
ncbi:hypothetical protein [Allomuricauda sp. d1]|uniref:hypothetical protein n=1 Tax=Allomuricauda sp. d1 TaxID=3136725 RepID=UPI0031DD8625